MADRQIRGAGPRDTRRAVLALLCGGLIWGAIWYPYRLLRDAGVDGVFASTLTYAVALVFGVGLFRRSLASVSWSWAIVWLALASAGSNVAYVMATLTGEVVRVLLLFYLAPLWTVLLSRLLLGERLNRFGAFVVALSLGGALAMLWQPSVGLPLPRDAADWYGLGGGVCFALANVLSRQAQGIAIEIKAMAAFVGVLLVCGVLLLCGVAHPSMPVVASPWLLIALTGGALLLVNLVAQYGLARIAANRAAVILLSEVGFAALSSWLLADEVPGLREWAGGAMIVAASVFSAKMDDVQGVESAPVASAHCGG